MSRYDSRLAKAFILRHSAQIAIVVNSVREAQTAVGWGAEVLIAQGPCSDDAMLLMSSY